MATKNVKDFLPIPTIDITTTDSLLGVVNNELRRVTNANISLQTITAKSGFFDNTGDFNYVGFNNNPLSVLGSGNFYLQQNIQNFSIGTAASSDLVLTSNAGTDVNNYIDLGINNVGYSDPAFSISSGNDGYLYNNGGNLNIGTQTVGKTIKLHAGGTKLENQTIEIHSSGLTLGTGCNIYGTSTYQRINANFVTGALPSTVLSFNLEGGKVYELDQYFRFTPGLANSNTATTSTPVNVPSDGYRFGINTQTLFMATTMTFVGDANNSTNTAMLGDITGVSHHIRKGTLRPTQNSTINFQAGSHNGVSTTLALGSYVIVKKLT